MRPYIKLEFRVNINFLNRQISGALVHIAKGEGTHENGENEDRHITITGNQDSISVAKYLIEMRYIYIYIFLIT